MCIYIYLFPDGSEAKASASNVGDLGSITGSGRSSGEGKANPLQYSCLENPMDGEAWWTTVQGVAKMTSKLKYTYMLEKHSGGHFAYCKPEQRGVILVSQM